MSEVSSCLLCLNSCSDYKCLYDADGVYDMELYTITVKYFNTMFLTETSRNEVPVVCFKCWQCMSEFNQFQSLIIKAHDKLSKESYKLSPEAEGDQRANRIESPSKLGIMDEGSFKMQITAEPTCISNVEKLTANYIEQSIHFKKHPAQTVSCDENSQSVNLNDIDINLEGHTEPESLLSGEESDDNSLLQQCTLRNPKLHSSTDDSAGSQYDWIYHYMTEGKKIYKTAEELENIISKWKSDFECAICHVVVHNFPQLRSHTKREHPKMKCQITCCQRLHSGASIIAKHAMFHMDPQSFKCHECSKLFSSSENLSRHRRQVHSMATAVGGSVTFHNKCRMCGKIFVNRGDLEEHEANHMGIKLHTCLMCSKTFTYRSGLYRHSRKNHPTEWMNRKGTTTKSVYTTLTLDDVIKGKDILQND